MNTYDSDVKRRLQRYLGVAQHYFNTPNASIKHNDKILDAYWAAKWALRTMDDDDVYRAQRAYEDMCTYHDLDPGFEQDE